MSFNLDSSQGLATTTDATPTTVATYDFDANGLTDVSGIVTVSVVGFDSSQNTVCIEQKYAVKRDTGNCSLVGLAATNLNNRDLALALVSVSLSPNGSAIDLNVTGLISTTIYWGAKIAVQYLIND